MVPLVGATSRAEGPVLHCNVLCSITFRAMGQVLASGIRWAGQGLSCVSADVMEVEKLGECDRVLTLSGV